MRCTHMAHGCPPRPLRAPTRQTERDPTRSRAHRFCWARTASMRRAPTVACGYCLRRCLRCLRTRHHGPVVAALADIAAKAEAAGSAVDGATSGRACYTPSCSAGFDCNRCSIGSAHAHSGVGLDSRPPPLGCSPLAALTTPCTGGWVYLQSLRRLQPTFALRRSPWLASPPLRGPGRWWNDFR